LNFLKIIDAVGCALMQRNPHGAVQSTGYQAE